MAFQSFFDSVSNVEKDPDNVLNTPIRLSYMRRIRFSLTTIGAWPYKELKMKNIMFWVNNKFLFSIWFSCWLVQISYIKKSTGVISFFELGHSYITVFMNCISLQRMTMVWTQAYKDMVRDFVQKMHLYHMRDQSEYALKIVKQIDKYCWILRVVQYYQAYFAVSFFNIMPLVTNYYKGAFDKEKSMNVTYEHSVYYDLPIPYKTEFMSYLTVAIANCFLTYDCAFAFCSFDVLIFVIVLHLWGHIKILKFNIKSVGDIGKNKLEHKDWSVKCEMFGQAELDEVSVKMKECINYHTLIKGFMDQTSGSFGVMVASYFVFHQVSHCILLLEMSQLDYDSVVRYGALTLCMFQSLMLNSIIFEQLGSESDTIKDYVYDLPWERMDVKNRRMLLYFLFNTMEPLAFKAVGVVPIGVRTMAAVFKNSLSYFMFLKTTAEAT